MALGNLRLPTAGERVSNGLAWLSQIVAAIGGLAASACFIGSTISTVVGWFWWGISLILIVVVGGLVMHDIAKDGIPNRRAVYGSIVWPSLVLSMPGKAGDKLNGWFEKATTWMDDKFAVWISDGNAGTETVMTAIALTSISFAVLWAQQYAKGRKGGGAATVSAGTNSPPVVSRRGR